MRPIPFYSDEEPLPLGWRRPAVCHSSATDKRYDTLMDALAGQARRSYWTGRWLVRHPRKCADLLRAQLRLNTALRAGEVVTLDGVKVRLCHDYSLRLARDLLAGTYAASERTLLNQAVEADDRVLEVGTGIGLVATLCARRVGDANVSAYEAHPAMVRRARETFALNGVSPAITQCALGAVAGSRTLYAGELLGEGSQCRDAQPINVPGERLADAICRDRPTLLIIDVEGGERELVKDAIGLRVPKILIAFHPELLGPFAVMRARRMFAQAGYAVVAHSEDGNRVLYKRTDTEAPTLTDAHGAAGA